jgi:hypothetical protein
MNEIHVLIILMVVIAILRYLYDILRKRPRKYKRVRRPRQRRRQRGRWPFLSPRIKAKAERKYRKLLSKFKRRHRRKPSKDDLFGIVVTASHHTFPVKGRNVRRWTKGKRGHRNRQKVRKYLLEKHKIVKNYRMK